MSCVCAKCKNRTKEICGRYPDFLNENECKKQKIEWDEEWFVDCENCDDGCHTILCVYYKE